VAAATILGSCDLRAENWQQASSSKSIDLVDRLEDVRLADENPPEGTGVRIEFDVESECRTSVGVFDRNSGQLVRTLLCGEPLLPGRHAVPWDGLDNRGRTVAAGDYEWRLIASPGFRAKYIMTIGINPPGGENPVPRRSWVGDHNGAGIVDVDESGIYVGSPVTEGLMMLAKVDSASSRVLWTREQFYQGGRLTRAATSGQHVYLLHPNGKLRRLNKANGDVEAEWQVRPEGEAPSDVDARGDNLVVVENGANRVTWLSSTRGKDLATVPLTNPSCVAVIEPNERGGAVVGCGRDLYIVHPERAVRRVATLGGSIGAIDYDPTREELWAVVDGHQVVRLNADFQVVRTYGDQPREQGPLDPTRFAGVYDIAADLQGGFFVGEPGQPPRRVAHLSRDGSLIEQWFGGMSFYVGGAFDPADPSLLYGIAPEGAVNVYRINYEAGTWDMEASYSTGRLGDGMFPFAGAYRAVRRNGELYLYHRVIPSVLRLDPHLRRAVPVAIAGRVINQGRTFFQFAGSGREGYPRPWIAAAEQDGYRDPNQAPALYSWTDTDGNGEFDPAEFRFYAEAKRRLSFHNPGDFARNGDYIGPAKTNEPYALVRLPVSNWEGPKKSAPRWDWDRVETAGEITADSYGYGSPRSVTVGPDDSVSVSYQAGIMIREHDQFEGGGWPESALRGARVLGFDAKSRPTFVVGRQSKDSAEANTGVLYYPMQTATGPNHSIIVNDQTKQPAQVWTHDGLYVGGFFDNRADDGRDAGFYRVHGDDNQGATLVTANNGKTYWLMPYQGHNRLYEITGWNDWQRQSGAVTLPRREAAESINGSGLTARYDRENQLMLETIEAPIYYEPFAAERHSKEVSPPYKVEWIGFVTPPVADRYQFYTLLGTHEQAAIWIDGRLVHADGFRDSLNRSIDLIAGHRHRIRIEYINPDGRAELKLLWSSRVIDPTRLAREALYPASTDRPARQPKEPQQ
jgi:hypothetical protein